MGGIIPTPQDFMLSGSVIQAIYIFQLIMNIGSCQAPLPIMGLLKACLNEEAIKEATRILNIRQTSLSYSNAIRLSNSNLISPPSYPTSLN